jgi:hypothetical protein
MAGMNLPCKSFATVTPFFTLRQSNWIQFVATRRKQTKGAAFEFVCPVRVGIDIALARRMALRLYHYQLNQLSPP